MKKTTRLFYTAALFLWDMISVYLSVLLGLRLRFGFTSLIPEYYLQNQSMFIFTAIFITIVSNLIFHCYNSVWQRAGAVDVIKQTCSGLFIFSTMTVLDRVQAKGMPKEALILIGIFLTLFMLIGRMFFRFTTIVKAHVKFYSVKKNLIRVIIYGAGETGCYLSKNLSMHAEDGMIPVAFIDDNKSLWGAKIDGVKVVGGRDRLEKAIHEYRADEVIVAITCADNNFIKEIMAITQANKCALKRYGTIDDVQEKDLSNLRIANINLEDLLRRDCITLNMNAVEQFVKDKTVLVTGGAGSIGSEICRQVLKFGCSLLLVFDINENGLFFIDNELKESFDPSRFKMILGTVREQSRLQEIMKKYKPQLVFHAAAHKHVPMMELNPKEAIKNNVFGTIKTAQAAICNGVEKFILISTDKAVNPTNIMGASKRIAELVIQMMDKVSDRTDFAAVRFGNVLGSNGSVVPFFKKQIEAGGPVTVTHPDMRRYFMTIPEAVQLVLEAGAMANGGEIFVLDMGKPVKIYDLACDLIRLYGLRPGDDIPIVFTGLRPGEKLFEEISLKEEDTAKTSNNKIYINKPVYTDMSELAVNIKALERSIQETEPDQMFAAVKTIVSTFKHEENKNIMN